MKQVLPRPVGEIKPDLFQRDVIEFLKQISSIEIIDGQLLEAVELTTSGQRISHRLGRKARGFFLVDSSADVRVFRDSTLSVDSTLYLPLQASSACTVTLWVF